MYIPMNTNNVILFWLFKNASSSNLDAYTKQTIWTYGKKHLFQSDLIPLTRLTPPSQPLIHTIQPKDKPEDLFTHSFCTTLTMLVSKTLKQYTPLVWAKLYWYN